MVQANTLEHLKTTLREEICPFFSDDDLLFYLKENNFDVNKTIYQCLIVKSEDTTLSISGLQAADTSKYFRRLAQRYRSNNSGVLPGG